MKHVKLLGLLAIATTALMAFAASASATQVTAPSGTLYTGGLTATNESTLTLKGVATVNCTASSLAVGKIDSHGAGVTAKGNISTLTLAGCDQHVAVKLNGTLEFHANGGGNATVTLTLATITIEFTTIFGNIHCNIDTKNTDIGELTSASGIASHGTLHLKGALPIEAGSIFLCGNSLEILGALKFNTPTGLRFD